MPESSAKEPEKIVARRMVPDLQRQQDVREVLVHWKNRGTEEDSWENLYKLQQNFPDFDAEVSNQA